MNGRLTVPGSKTNAMTPEQVREAVRATPTGQDFVWDGVEEDDRPPSPAELAQARGRGRPAGSGRKAQVAIRLDRDLLAALRATGPGWQTRVNALLQEALTQGRLKG